MACGPTILRTAHGRRSAWIRIATWLNFGRWRRRQATGNVGIAHVASVASTDHRTQRQRVEHLALGVRSARSRLGARILADPGKAGLSTRTVGIDGALRLVLDANDAALAHTVAAEARRAGA